MLTIKDIIEFTNWLKNKKRLELIETAKSIYGNDFPISVYQFISDKIQSISADELSGNDIESFQYLMWLERRKTNPAVKLEDCDVRLDEIEMLKTQLFPKEFYEEKKT